ncbi:MAG: hypothetical protein Q4A67_01025 [Aerococcus sp.]|nr:hypothetical protein [Aerococcus sp.]
MTLSKTLRVLAFIFLVLTAIAFFAPIDRMFFKVSIAILLVISLAYQAMRRKKQ